MAKYNTVERTKSIDRETDTACMMGVESVTAGGYGPEAEERFCPSRNPSAIERREYAPDELTSDDRLDLEMMADNVSQDQPTSDRTWRPLTARQREIMPLGEQIAHSLRNPATAWLRNKRPTKGHRSPASRATMAYLMTRKDGKGENS